MVVAAVRDRTTSIGGQMFERDAGMLTRFGPAKLTASASDQTGSIRICQPGGLMSQLTWPT